jgi:hypothetical protein
VDGQVSRRALTIRWDEELGDPPTITYYVDGSPVGQGDVAFDEVLEAVRASAGATVKLSIRSSVSLGGGSLVDSLPFGARIDELRAAAGEGRIIYEFR